VAVFYLVVIVAILSFIAFNYVKRNERLKAADEFDKAIERHNRQREADEAELKLQMDYYRSRKEAYEKLREELINEKDSSSTNYSTNNATNIYTKPERTDK